MNNLRVLLLSMLDGMDGDARKAGSHMASHMPTLYALAHQWSFGHIVELGVNRGWSTVALFLGALAAGQRLTSYDHDASWRQSLPKNLGLPPNHPILSSWEFRRKDSVQAAADFQDETVSLWFLDTSHVLENTRRELSAWLPKMSPDGLMCGHDYFLEGYDNVKCGVKQAVDEFATAHANRFDLQILPHDYGLFVLRPKHLGRKS